MQKPAYIVPDWLQQTDHAAYFNVGSALRANGYTIQGSRIQWNSKTLTDWAERFSGELASQPQPSAVCAFGLGAMVALAASARTPIGSLLLCSPAGHFKEYITRDDFVIPRWVGEPRLADFLTHEAKTLFDKLQVTHCRILIDDAETVNRGWHESWLNDLTSATGWEVTPLPHQAHGMMGLSYQRAVMQAIRELP